MPRGKYTVIFSDITLRPLTSAVGLHFHPPEPDRIFYWGVNSPALSCKVRLGKDRLLKRLTRKVPKSMG